MKSSLVSTLLLLVFVAVSLAGETEQEAAVPRVRGSARNGHDEQQRELNQGGRGKMKGYMKGWTIGKMNPHRGGTRDLNQGTRGKMKGLTRGKMKGWTKPQNPH